MSDMSRLELVIDSKGVVTANGNLDLFKKKSDDAAKAATSVETANKKNAKSFDLVNSVMNVQTIAMGAANLAMVKFMNSCAETGGIMEMLKTNLQVVTGSAKEADTIFRGLQSFAAETPFGIQGITDTAIQLMQVGVAADELQEQLRMLGDVSGGSQEKLNRIMVNYTQILSVGKASTMDIRQFAQANLPIYAELERVTGKTGEALQDMITGGKITGEVITQAFKNMTAEGGKFFNGMSLAADTWQGKKSTMLDSISNVAAKFSDLWLLDFQKNAFDAITAVSDELAEFFDEVKFGKTAFDMFDTNYAATSFDQREYVANEQIKYYKDRLNALKGSYSGTGLDYKNDREYKELSAELEGWYDYLDKIVSTEASAIIQERELQSAAELAAEAAKKAAAEAAIWQEVLKDALDLSEVTTGAKAVEDFIEKTEAALGGSIAYAQAFGENVTDVYYDYATNVQKAVKTLLESGLWSPDEKTIQRLMAYIEKLKSIASARTGFTNYDLASEAQNPDFMNNQDAFKFGSFNNPTGFNFANTFNLENELLKLKDSISDWSEYMKNSALQAGMKSIQGTDAGNFANGMMQGGWQQGLIDMVIGAFMKNLEDVEGFQRALNLVTEALGPAAGLLGDVMDALAPLMDALVIGGEIGQDLAEVTLMLEPVMPLIKFISTVIYVASVVLQKAFGVLDDLTGWLFGDITDDMNKFSDSMYKASESVDSTTEDLIQALKDLKDQIREEQQYYDSQKEHLNATADSQTQYVNDAIIAPGGNVITTHPDDYLIATKTPGSLGGGTTEVKIESIVQNYASGSVTVEQKKRIGGDGNAQLITVIRQIVKNDVASGELDDAFDSMNVRRSGMRRGS